MKHINEQTNYKNYYNQQSQPKLKQKHHSSKRDNIIQYIKDQAIWTAKLSLSMHVGQSCSYSGFQRSYAFI